MKKILLATDFSDLARGAYSAAAAFARENDAEIHLVHEAEPLPPLYYEQVTPDFPIADYFEALRRKTAKEAHHPALAGLQVTPHLLCEESRYDRLVDFARGEQMELIVIATHGRTGLSHALLGSFTEKVARYATVPVFTYRTTAESTGFAPRTILVPFDFSENARTIFRVVRALHKDHGSDVRLLHVIPDEFMYDYWRFAEESRNESRERRTRSTQQLEKTAKEELENPNVTVETRWGNPYLEIVREAGDVGADLIVMATHGWTGLKHFFFGSVAEKVLRTAPCSVITMRPEEIRPQELRESQAITAHST